MKRFWRNILHEPYRLLFLVGSIMAISTGLHWYFFFSFAPDSPHLAAFARPPIALHAQQMVFLALSYFIAGFALTAFPRWIASPEKPVQPMGRCVPILAAVLLCGCEGAMFFAVRRPSVFLVFAACLVLSIWGVFWVLGRRLFAQRPVPEQPARFLAAMFLGGLGALMGSMTLYSGEWPLGESLSLDIGLYGYLLLLTLTVAERVVPFFTSKAIPEISGNKDLRLGRKAMAAIGLHLASTGLILFLPERGDQLLQIRRIADALLAFALGSALLTWLPPAYWGKAIRKPLLASLYLGLFWIDVYLFLSPLQWISSMFSESLATWLLWNDKHLLHILTLGGFSTVVVAMMTRVTRGHGGVPLQLGKSGGLAIILLQIAMFWRVGTGLNGWHRDLLPIAGILWSVAFLVWLIGHARILARDPA